ncbi:MAG: preprotein translocase subunit SecG [Mycoplasmoidaceae bacterium]
MDIKQIVEIIIFVLIGLAFLIAVLLSGHGSPAGLSGMTGQDLELFKQTKDRGIVKVLQIFLFLSIIIIITSLIIYRVLLH